MFADIKNDDKHATNNAVVDDDDENNENTTTESSTCLTPLQMFDRYIERKTVFSYNDYDDKNSDNTCSDHRNEHDDGSEDIEETKKNNPSTYSTIQHCYQEERWDCGTFNVLIQSSSICFFFLEKSFFFFWLKMLLLFFLTLLLFLPFCLLHSLVIIFW